MSPLRKRLLEFQIEQIVNEEICAECKNVSKIGEIKKKFRQTSKGIEEIEQQIIAF
jgi:hypothetical protein